MIRVAVCDDEKQVCDYLKTEVTDYFAQKDIDGRVTLFYDGDELVNAYRQNQADFDLILLDITMKHLDGLSAAQKIREINRDVLIVFITASAEYVFRGYEVNAFRYILKPDLQNGFTRIFSDCIAHITQADEEKFVFQTGAESVSLFMKDILYFESDKRKIMVHCSGGKEYSYYGKLDAVEESLKKMDFVRCHQSFLINAKKILSVGAGTVTLTDDLQLPVSRHRQKETDAAFLWAMR